MTSIDPFNLRRPEIPYRVVFADEVEPGDVILETCRIPCDTIATNHLVMGPHQLTVERVRNTDGTVTGIVLDEDGGQQPWTAPAGKPVQLRDDTAQPTESAVTNRC